MNSVSPSVCCSVSKYFTTSWLRLRKTKIRPGCEKPQISHPLTSQEHTHTHQCARMFQLTWTPNIRCVTFKSWHRVSSNECTQDFKRWRNLVVETRHRLFGSVCSDFSRQALYWDKALPKTCQACSCPLLNPPASPANLSRHALTPAERGKWD